MQLCRIPNVFTAAADVLMGWFLTHPPGIEPAAAIAGWGVLLSLVLSSACLYVAGMVLNDVFDVELDRRERPQRPIPSGRVTLRAAQLVGFELLLLGVACGWLASYLADTWRPGAVATLLAVAVLAYDAWLKRTPLAAGAMGACRFLNVLLGMSAAIWAFSAFHFLAAGGIGLYVAGITLFGRREAAASRPAMLMAAMAVMAGGIGLLAAFASFVPMDFPPGAVRASFNWYFLLGVLAVLILWRCLRAALDPTPSRVQAAVKHAILSIIFLDAAATVAIRGATLNLLGGTGLLVPVQALIILALLPPAIFLGRYVYST